MDLEEEIDDGYYENNDLYNFGEYLEEEYYYEYEDDENDEDDYEDEDEKNEKVQYDLLLKDAKRCGFNDVNNISIKILRDFIFEYIKLNSDIVFLINSYIIKNDIEIMKYLIQKQVFYIQYASKEIKNNYAIGLYCVKKCSTTLEYLSLELRDNYDIVYNAVKRYNKSLCFASNRLKNDKTLLSICLNDRCFYFFKKSYNEYYIINNLPMIYYFMIKKNRKIGNILRYYSNNFMNNIIKYMKILKYLYIFDNVAIIDENYSIRESLYDGLDVLFDELLEYM